MRLHSTAAIAAAVLAVPAAGGTTVSVPSLFKGKVAHARRVSGLAVLLPRRLDAGVPARRLSATANARRGHYTLEIGIGRDCRGADACFVAAFLADRGGRAAGGSRVSLARGRIGHFHPRSCGASCAAPDIEWVEHRVLYTIQDRVPNDRRARAVLKALASSAILAGPR
jgi:hypothetical protein